MNFIKSLNQFKEYKLIIESFGEELFDIPGLHKVNAHLKGDSIEIQYSNGDISWLELKSLKNVAMNISNLQPDFLEHLGKLWEKVVLSRYSADAILKIKTLKEAESCAYFQELGISFFDDLLNGLEELEASEEDISIISNNIDIISTIGGIDGISPEGMATLNKWLNLNLECVGAKIYIYLKYLRKDDIVIFKSRKWKYR